MNAQATPSLLDPLKGLCPTCGNKGKAVKDVTIRSLVSEEARSRIDQTDGFCFCAEPSCDIAYFRPETDERFFRQDVRIRIGQKETGQDRKICYCFDHSAEEIAAEVEKTGTSKIPDRIAEQCRNGLSRCEETNPQGSCCLGNVHKVVKDAQDRSDLLQADFTIKDADKTEDCCAGREQERETLPARSRHVGLWAAVVAVISAILSSACCWLPLLLILFGMSAAGISGFFDAYRLYFLGATALLLATGFYFTYFRKEKCEPGSACAVPNQKLVRFNKVMLWIATVVILLFALFPNYFALLASVGDRDAQVTVNVDEDRIVRLQITGMTCETCAVHLRKALSQVADVSPATVSYKEKTALLIVSPGTEIPREAILNAISRTGYTGSFVDETDKSGKGREVKP